MKYKLRFYENNGKFSRELYFDDIKQAEKVYKEHFNYLEYYNNPTMWEYDESTNEYHRILGY